MAYFTAQEFIDLLIMTAGVGFIFTGLFRLPDKYGMHISGFKDFLISTAIAAPGVILHEFAHKAVAIGLGLSATFHAAYTWLGFGILLKLLNFGIFFVPGYVTISGGSALQSSLSAFAGPFLNLVLALVCLLILKYKKGLSHTIEAGLIISKKLNFFLFGFNMLPIPPFDGFKVFYGLWQVISGVI